MKRSHSLEISKGVTSHILEDELLLFDPYKQSLYLLNSTAAHTWCLLEAGNSLEEICDELVLVFGIPSVRLQSDIDGLINEWLSIGLVRDSSVPALIPNTPLESSVRSTPRLLSTELRDNCRFRSEIFFRLARTTFRLRLPSAIEESAVRPIFSHLECSSRTFDISLDVTKSENRYAAFNGAETIGAAATPIELGPMLSQEALRVAYSSCDRLIAVHAGVVGTAESCVVLAGPSGAGKSTLTAALVGAGFMYYSDEVAIIERKTHLLIPCPISLRIKSGSLDVVKTLFDNAKICRTVDYSGEVINYVVPQKGSFANGETDSGTVSAIVFPTYEPSGRTEMIRIPKTDAISRLQATGYDVHGDLTSSKVEELVDWIKRVPCYELSVSSLKEAVELVAGVVG